jgi:ABC-type transport system substrate-binding protein
MSNKTLTLLMGFVAFLILVVGVVFAVVALGGGDDDDGGAPASGDQQPGRTSTPRPGGSTAGICQGKSLILSGSEPLSPFDPILVTDQTTSEYVVEIFGGLVTLDAKLQVVGDIAKEWTVSPDAKTYTFKLRDNVVFHDNKRVTAADVKYSLERAADPANASPTVKAYLGGIQGLKDKVDGKAKEISGVKVVNDTTIEIILNEPEDFFLQELTYPVAYVVSKDQIERDPRNWTRKPIGTGPFKVGEYSPTERVRLIRNDRYHLGAPKLEEVNFELGGGSISTRYENNELHIGFVPAQNLEDIRSGGNKLSKEYRPQPQLAVSYITLNSTKPPFDDPKVRQALAMSIDRENINKVLLYGYYRVADGFVPPEMPGYTESVRSYKYDVEAAKKLIAESKYAGRMPRVTLNYGGSGGNSPDTLVAIQQGWEEIGVPVELQAVDTAALLREQRRGTYQMLSEGWAADYPDIEDFLGKLFASDSTLNYTRYKNAEVDALLLQARRETDRNKRYQIYAQAEQKIVDDATVIPIFWPVEHTLVKPCVVGLPDAPMTIQRYRYVDIDPTK